MIKKTRFAPSPTGRIHLGNARTALFNLLVANHLKKNAPNTEQSIFLLRIEDTDLERSKEAYINDVCNDLTRLDWLWHEGEKVGGKFAPYRQSQRIAIYQKYFDQLLTMGYAYPCFCTAEILQRMRQEQKLAGRPPRYDRRCCQLDKQAIKRKKQQGEPFVLRFNTQFQTEPNVANATNTTNAEIIFTDLVKGKQRFPCADIGDFIIQKADGMPTFFFSNAIDDSLMQVTHVLRGDDHLTNTPRQLMLLQALQLPAPEYGHLSTIVGEDGTPLSKRNGSRTIDEMLTEGWLPLAITNYLARLGHYYASDELLSLPELADEFHFSNLGKSAAKFDWKLLQHWQRKALIAMNEKQLIQWLGDNVKDIPANDCEAFAKAIAPNLLLPKDSLLYKQIIYEDIEWQPELRTFIAEAKQQHPNFLELFYQGYENKLNYQQLIENIRQNTQLKGKTLFQLLRTILTGQQHGPAMAELLPLIPPNQVKKRLQYWIDFD